jgi:N-acetylglucosamine repressor
VEKDSYIGSRALVSTVNTRLVLEAVRTMGPTYRAEVARKTRLNPATVTGIVNDLLERELLLEIPGESDENTRNGRPPQMLQVNANSRDILAIDLEPDRVRVAVLNLMLVVREYHERLIDRFSSPELICNQILELCREVRSRAGERPLQGVGVSLPGLVDMDNGILIGPTNMPKMVNVPIREILERELDTPVHLERSMHLASLYEQWMRVDGFKGSSVVVTLRTGIGISLMRGGELYLGGKGYDGEIGHTVVDLNGEACECGGSGCLETFVSAAAICRRVNRMLAEGRCESVRQACDGGAALQPELVYRLAKSGDGDCAQIVREVGRYIGIAVANMINVLAPDEVVICGSIDTADELILESVREQIQQRALPCIRENVVVRLAAAKERSPLLGAAVLVAKRLFELPKLSHAQ